MRSLWLNYKNEPFQEQSSELIEQKHLKIETNQKVQNSWFAIGINYFIYLYTRNKLDLILF
jgi:hypothetical protein